MEFNGVYSAPIKYTATEAEIKAALEQMDIINSVTVNFQGSVVTACTNGISGTDGFVNFNDVVNMAGDLPIMSATTNSLGGLRRVDVSSHTKGEAPLGEHSNFV